MNEQARHGRAFQIFKERQLVVAAAREWLGTPFHHGQRVKGHGVDCAQLLIGVFCMDTALVQIPSIEHYAKDWFLHERGSDRLLNVIRRSCVQTTAPQPGDIAVFRFGREVSHSAIMLNPPYLVHAERMIGYVIEDRCDVRDTLASRLEGYWTLRRWVEGGQAHV